MEAGMLKAIADPYRLRMLATLARAAEEVCVCDFTAALPLNQPTVSHHLRILREAGLVTCERRGTWVYYRLATGAAQQLEAATLGIFLSESTCMKTHLNFATSDLDKSVSFYSTLLAAEPAKKFADYALFVTDEPGLELALDLRADFAVADDVHYGIFVDTADEVEAAVERLAARGLGGSIEREETCCYANQTKVWAIDPEGRRWEIYTVHEDTEVRDDLETTCCSVDDDATRACCAA